MNRTIITLAALLLLAAAAFAQTTANDHVEKAKQLASSQDFAGAAAELGRAIEMQPSDIELYLRRANYHRFAKNIAGLRADVAKAWQLDPNREATLEHASRLLDSGYEEDCRTIITMSDTFLQRNSQSDKGYEARFRAKTCLGDIAGAFNDISMAVQLNPSHNGHRVNQATMISKLGNSAEAVRILDGLVKKLADDLRTADPGDARRITFELRSWLIARSRIHEQNGDIELAFADVNRTVELIPNADSFLYRARLLRRHKRFFEAMADLNRAINDRRRDPAHLYWERADMRAEIGQLSEAVADYELVLRLIPAERTRLEARIAAVRKQMEAVPR
jgi:tetratricopeptide (TPR) repeat protein